MWRGAGNRTILGGIARSTFVAVMGATGSGKSTLLHRAAGLDRPVRGSVTLAGREITRMREAALTSTDHRRVPAALRYLDAR
jgi:putative ABC transport system ATP-binding protein